MNILGYIIMTPLLVVLQGAVMTVGDSTAMILIFIAFMVNMRIALGLACTVGLLEGLIGGYMGLASMQYMILVLIAALLAHRILATRSLPALLVLGVVGTVLIGLMRLLSTWTISLYEGVPLVLPGVWGVLQSVGSTLAINMGILLLCYAICYYPWHKARAYMITG